MPRIPVIGAAVILSIIVPLRATAQGPDETWKKLTLEASYAAGAHDLAKAEQDYLKALHEAERFGPDDPRVGTTLKSLCGVYRGSRKYAEGESVCRRALSILEMTDADSLDVAETNFDIGRIVAAQSRYAAAVPLIRRTLTIYEKLLGGGSLQTAEVLCALGDTYRNAKSFTDAEAPLRRCADIREKDGGMQNTALAEALHSLALTYAGEGRYALAEERFKLAEKIRENTLGITSPLLARTMEDHAALLKTTGRGKEAQKLLLLSAAIRRNQKSK
jgi:tetratricopeptide (TPR) repeat protein